MKLLFFSAILLLSTACRGGKAPEAQTGGEDTLAKPLTLEELFLPDSVYASVQKVHFVVEQEDTLDYFLKDVDDRYAATWSSFTFRRNMLRDASFGGTLEKRPETVEIAWQFNTPEDNFSTHLGNWGETA